MKEKSNLNNKLIIITGGTKGIGLALANKFIEENTAVVTTSRKITQHSNKVNLGKITQQFLDVKNENSVKQFFSWISNQNYALGLLINNAGIGVFKPLLNTSLLEWEDVITTNLTGAFLCCKEAFKSMQSSGGGRIINIGSIADSIGIINNSAYTASKSGLKGLSSVLSEEGRESKIRVTHITLGAVYTEIWHNREGFVEQDMIAKSDIADIILNIAKQPLNIRIDNIEITPSKKVL